MPPKKMTVLAVDDDIRILCLLRQILEINGYRVLAAASGEDALNKFAQEMVDLVLLDIMMFPMDGYTVCERIREFSDVPIIMVTAKDAEEQKIQGLDAGADDYVTKPFAAGELMARVKAVLRRSRPRQAVAAPAFRCADLTVDFAACRVTRGEQEVNLTATEYRILACLARNAGLVLTPGQVLQHVWGEEYRGETHLLQVNIARLRDKLGDDASNPRYIFTRSGIGYTMPKPEVRCASSTKPA